MGALCVEHCKPEDIFGSLDRNEAQNAPTLLYLLGDSKLLKRGIRVSVAGSRRPSLDGIRRARSLTQQLVKHKIIVVSGLATGIEAVVHETAMDSGGRTIAVLGTPLNQVYPVENAGLQRRIAREHLLVSRFRTGSAIERRNIPMRNRIMALLSHATMIVEAAEYSGTVHLAWETMRLRRPLFLLENIVTNPVLTWPAEMIKRGAKMLSRDSLDECMEEIMSTVLVRDDGS